MIIFPQLVPAVGFLDCSSSAQIFTASAGSLVDCLLPGEVFNCEARDELIRLVCTKVWKETQREVQQHWFIYSYISAYIQGLYMYCGG